MEREHAKSPPIWLAIAKKGSRIASVSYAEALEEALRYGWIDGQRRSFDERYHLVGFGARRARSKWSQRNREIAERLIAERRMQPAGLAAVEAAKADGRWDDAYPRQSDAVPSTDFQAALDADPAAAARFATLNSIERYRMIYRLHHVKGPATRAARIERYLQELRQQGPSH